jgi:hypothetical protein
MDKVETGVNWFIFLIAVMSLSTVVYMSRKYHEGYDQMQRLSLDSIEKTYVASCITSMEVMAEDVNDTLAKSGFPSPVLMLKKEAIAKHCKEEATKYRQDLIRAAYQDKE